MRKLHARIAAVFTVAAFMGVAPVVTAGAADAARKPPTDSTQSQYPGGCVDIRGGTGDYPNGGTRVDSEGKVWTCKNGGWYTTVRTVPGGADRYGGGAWSPPRG